MKKLCSVLCLCALACFALLIVLQTGCKPANSDEVPITTTSKEARKLFVQGREMAEAQHPQEANGLFNQAIEKDPEFALAYLFKAGSASDAKEFKEARAKAISLASKASEGERKIIAAHQAYYDENNVVKTNQIYQELAGQFPNDKRVQWYLGGSYANLREYDKEIAAYERVLAIDKSFAPAYQALGYTYRWRNQYEKAEGYFKEYLRLIPQEANGHDNLADLYRKMGKFGEALEQYNEAVKMNPAFRSSEYKAGTTMFFMGKYEEGRQALRQLMDKETKPANKLYDLMAIVRGYIYEGDYPTALEATDKALQMSRDLGLPEQTAFNHWVKLSLYFELNDWDKAAASLAERIDVAATANLTPAYRENVQASNSFWQAMIAVGRKDFAAAQAIAAEFKARVEAVKNPTWQKFPVWLLGHIALAQGDAGKAIGYFSQGEMDDPWTMYFFALAKEKAGDTAGAAELYKNVANWNLDDTSYAFVRQKAAAKM
jgi:tetratricopeptide (TPR) repeat protein